MTRFVTILLSGCFFLLASEVKAQSISRGPDPAAPAGCGGYCLTERLPTSPIPSPVGCPSGFCSQDDYRSQVGAFSLVFRDNSRIESLSVTAQSVPPPDLSAPKIVANRVDLLTAVQAISQEVKVCSFRRDASTSVWREALVQRLALLACDRPVRALLEARESNKELYAGFLAGSASSALLKELFRAYKEACLQPLAEYHATGPFRALFGTSFSQSLSTNVGMLVGRRGSSEFRCTASVVRLSESPRRLGLITSAHCIGSRRAMGLENDQLESVFDPLEFTSLSGKKLTVGVDQSVKGWIYPTRNDLALISAPESVSDAFDGLPLGNPAALKAWEPLYLVGINPVLKALAAEGSGGTATFPLQLGGATITLSTPCRVVGIDRGRLVHNCETEEQMSGSPVFALQANGPAIVAVHRGGANSPEPLASCGPDSWPAVNEAVIVPSLAN